MRIAITGARGEFGTALCAFLESRGHQIFPAPRRKDLDLALDIAGARQWVGSVAADALVHLAGAKPPAPSDVLLARNAGSAFSILDAVQACGRPCRVLVASSAAVYADPPTPYSASKRIVEAICGAFRTSGLNVTSVRLFNIVGLDGDMTSFVPQFVQRVCRAFPRSRVLLRDADCQRDFIDVQDACRGFELLLATKEEVPSIVEMGTGAGLHVLDAARTIVDIMGSDVVVTPSAWEGIGVRDSIADLAPLAALGWSPQIQPSVAVANFAARCLEREMQME